MLTAAQARAVADLARAHHEQHEDLREKNRLEMQELTDTFGWPDPTRMLLRQLNSDTLGG